MKYLPFFLLLCAATLMLAACQSRHQGNRPAQTGGYYQDDGPPSWDRINVAMIPDAVPQAEPLSRSGNQPYRALGRHYEPIRVAAGFKQRGYASWYGRKFHGRRTSSGEIYDLYAMTAAHPTLPLPTYVHVRNLENGREVTVKVNDRGPFKSSRIIDLSYAAAKKLGIVETGTALVEITAVTIPSQPTPDPGSGQRTRQQDAPAFFIQAGAFADIQKALALRDRLKENGMAEVALEPMNQSGRRLYRVRLGPYADQAEARSRLPDITRISGAEARLIAPSAPSRPHAAVGPEP